MLHIAVSDNYSSRATPSRQAITHASRQAAKQAGRQADKEAGWLAGRQTKTHIHIQTNMRTYRHTYMQTDTDKLVHPEGATEHRERDKAYIQRYRNTEIHTFKTHKHTKSKRYTRADT